MQFVKGSDPVGKARDEAAATLHTVYPKVASEIADVFFVPAEAKVAAGDPEPSQWRRAHDERRSDGQGPQPGANDVGRIEQQVVLPARFGATSQRTG